MPYPLVDDALAADVAAAAGVDLAADVETVVAGLRAWLPSGSTAKLEAIAAGVALPGPDPATALDARLAGSPVGWSCWPLCTGIGGVLAAAGHDVRVLVEHRRERHDVEVDFHSVLVVDGDMVDPYLGPSAPVPLGSEVTRPDAWARWDVGQRPDHHGVRGGGSPYWYRSLADRLEAADVAAFCAISVTHSGVGDRPYVQWVSDGSIHMIRSDSTDRGGPGRYQVSIGPDPFAQTRDTRDEGTFDDLVSAHLPPS